MPDWPAHSFPIRPPPFLSSRFCVGRLLLLLFQDGWSLFFFLLFFCWRAGDFDSVGQWHSPAHPRFVGGTALSPPSFSFTHTHLSLSLCLTHILALFLPAATTNHDRTNHDDHDRKSLGSRRETRRGLDSCARRFGPEPPFLTPPSLRPLYTNCNRGGPPPSSPHTRIYPLRTTTRTRRQDDDIVLRRTATTTKRQGT